MKGTTSWLPNGHPSIGEVGGIFGLEFTPDGRVLSAATEHRSVLFLDPLRCAKVVGHLPSAHSDCVNCVRFLDTRLFTTCSDDHTVKLWDLRYLGSYTAANQTGPAAIRTFRGHSNWVKNIEVMPESGAIITSSFDNFIIAWDLNDPTSEPRRLFQVPGLMRMRLTPACDKMIVSTHWGYIFVVHHLDIENIGKDLFGFKPYSYWIAHASGRLFPVERTHHERFFAERNRTELIFDFPHGCEPDNVSSIVPHPYGWVVASRCTNSDERSEWTCIHDIQLPATVERPFDDDDLEEKNDADENLAQADTETRDTGVQTSLSFGASMQPGSSSGGSVIALTVDQSSGVGGSVQVGVTELAHPAPPSVTTARNTTTNDSRVAGPSRVRHHAADSSSPPPIRRPRITSTLRGSLIADNADITTQSLFSRFNFITNNRGLRFYDTRARNVGEPLPLPGLRDDTPRTLVIRNAGRFGTANRMIFIMGRPRDMYVHSNRLATTSAVRATADATAGPSSAATSTPPSMGNSSADELPPLYRRLSYYISEPRCGRGYIKEQSWSLDGRLLASPHGFGVRLLAFDEHTNELCDIAPSPRKPARLLHELSSSYAHSNAVLACRFSPTHEALLATGCLSGKVVLHQPRTTTFFPS